MKTKEQIRTDNIELLQRWDDHFKECDLNDFCFERYSKEKNICKCGHYAGLHEMLDKGWYESGVGGFLPSIYPSYIWGKCDKCECKKFERAD